MLKNKELFTKFTQVDVGDYLMQRSRFKPSEYKIYKICEANWSKNYMLGIPVFDTDKGQIPKERQDRHHAIFMEWDAHYRQQRSAYLTYKLDKNHPYVLVYADE